MAQVAQSSGCANTFGRSLAIFDIGYILTNRTGINWSIKLFCLLGE